MTLIPIELTKTPHSELSHCVPPSSFLQTPFWCEFKSSQGWTSYYFEVITNEPFFLSVLVKKIARFFYIAYIPLGPDIQKIDIEQQGIFLELLGEKLQFFLPTNTIYIRFDPPWGTIGIDTFPRMPRGKKLRPAPSVQPPDTVILDLTQDDESLLVHMKSKWRYNIRLGEKKGLEIAFSEGIDGAGAGINVFYQLYLETATRDGIAIHKRSYYEELLKLSSTWVSTAWDKPISMRVYVASHGGENLASIITLFCGEEAVYLYGASSNKKRNLMPAYSLQWKAIRDARDFGCTRYDFYGIPPTDDASHPMHGLYRFKTGFGGSVVHRIGSLDIPLKPLSYSLWRSLESMRSVWFKQIKKRIKQGILRKS